MSDSWPSSEENSVADATPPKTGSRGGGMRVLFVVNGVVCCVLIAALVVFGLRDKRSAEDAGSEANTITAKIESLSQPLASATDPSEKDDDDGKPKVMKIEMKWSEEGVADFEFTERSGKAIRKQDLLGHPWIAGFIFSNCAGPCFKVSGAMRKLQDEFCKNTDLRLVSFTVDPERDTPEVLTKYANGFESDSDRWLFLTGDRSQIYKLILGSFLMPVGEETGERRQPGFEFIHTTNILLVDEHGVVQGKWNSTNEAEFDTLRRALRKRLRKTTDTSSSGDDY